MNIRRLAGALLTAAALMVFTSSCDNKELCFNHAEHTPRYASKVNADYELIWEHPYDNATDWPSAWGSLNIGLDYDALRPAVPEGIRMTAYNAGGMRTETNLEPYGEEVYLPGGENSILFYNNDTEFIVFNNMGSYEEASATTRSRYRASYAGNPYYTPPRSVDTKSGESTVSAPDVLFGHYIDSYMQNKGTSARQLDITMRPLVFTYVICYRFKSGYDYVALARGALAGMAGSVFLNSGRTSARSVTILYDCTLEPWGILAEVRSFGVPNFPNPSYSRAEGDFALTLEVRLKNGKIANYYFDITEQMQNQPHGGVIEVDGIEIKPEDGESGGSGFDISVDDWGEFEDVPVDF